MDTIFNFPYKDISLGAGEKIYAITEEASGMGRIGEVGDRANDGQAVWCMGHV